VIRVVLLFALLLAVAWAFWRLMDGVIDTFGGLPRNRGNRGARGPAPVKLVRDPACGTWVDPKAALAAHLGGATHYFCSTDCRDKYRAQPESDHAPAHGRTA